MCELTYDALLSCTGSIATTLGTLNPLRYRGYVYDQEIGYYYLQSRYYVPKIGRFLNADGLVSTGQGLLGNNMFVYCGNNPIIHSDSTGYFFEETIERIKLIVDSIKQIIDSINSDTGFIYSQDDPSIANKKLGSQRIVNVGCGVVATFNVLCMLGNPQPFNEVLSYFNGCDLLWNGRVGVDTSDVLNYFNSHGYSAYATDDMEIIELVSKDADACIMFYWWQPEPGRFFRAHYFAYREYVTNEYHGYNVWANSVALYKFSSPVGFLNENSFVGATCIYIYKPEG